MKTTRRNKGQSMTVKGLLYMVATFFAALTIGCSTGQEPQTNSVAQGSHCIEECCGPGCGSGGTGADSSSGLIGGTGGEGNIGSTGGTGGASATGGSGGYVGGTGGTTSQGGGGAGTGGQGNTGNAGGTGGTEVTGGQGGTGGTTTTTETGGTGGSGGTTTTTTDTGGTGGTTTTTTTGSGGTGGTTEPPHSFSCSGWTRDATFDAFKIDGSDIQLVGGIWGTSSSNIYVTAGTYTKPVVAHWNGTSWVSEPLPGNPMTAFSIWGSSDDDVWVTAKTSTAGMLYHRTGGIWVDDTNKPYAKAFEDIWGADSSNIWLMGWKTTGYKIWRKNGSTWVEQTLPTIPTPYSYKFTRVWGLDANNVFVTGYSYDSGSNSIDGFLLYWNGSNWLLVGSLPINTKEFSAMHGTSIDDVFVTGSNDAGKGVIYHVTGKLATWNEYADPNVSLYGQVWSKFSGTVLAAGTDPPAQAGAERTTLLDEVTSPQTDPVDSYVYGVVRIWPEPGSDAVHFVHVSAPGTIAGHYTTTCND